MGYIVRANNYKQVQVERERKRNETDVYIYRFGDDGSEGEEMGVDYGAHFY